MIVIDASALLEILKRTDKGIELSVRLEEEEVHAPHLIDLEVAQVLRRLVVNKEISAGDAQEAIQELIQMPLTRHSHFELLPQVWAMRHNISAYDACYVALAGLLNAEFLTLDEKLRQAAAQRIH